MKTFHTALVCGISVVQWNFIKRHFSENIVKKENIVSKGWPFSLTVAESEAVLWFSAQLSTGICFFIFSYFKAIERILFTNSILACFLFYTSNLIQFLGKFKFCGGLFLASGQIPYSAHKEREIAYQLRLLAEQTQLVENYFNLMTVKAGLGRKKQQQTLKNIPFLFPCSLQTVPFHPDRNSGNGWEGLVSTQQLVFGTSSLSYFSLLRYGLSTGSSPSADSLLQSGSSMGTGNIWVHLLQCLGNILHLLLLWPWCQQRFLPPTHCMGFLPFLMDTFPKMPPHCLLSPVVFCGGSLKADGSGCVKS